MIQFKHEMIKVLRTTHGLTLEEMANKMGKQKQQLGIWENGVNEPTMKNFVDICNTFDVEPDFFFDVVDTHVEEVMGN